MKFRKTSVAAALLTALALAGCSTTTEEVAGMKDPTIWSIHGTGTATYTDLAAIANTVSANEGVRIRLTPSETSIGRLAPIRAGVADMGRLADEHYFAFEGIEDFGNEDWGPQTVNVVWAPLSPSSLTIREDSGIETPADLRGKRVPVITASAAVNMKIEAVLAYGGLTMDDVIPVPMALSEQQDSLHTGEVDVAYGSVYSSAFSELDSKTPIAWLDLDSEDSEAMARMQAVDPTITDIMTFENGPGQDPGQVDPALTVSIPLVTYAETDEDFVYHTVRNIVKNYDSFKDTTMTTNAWGLDGTAHAPSNAPFHPGTIRFLKEEGLWTPEAEERNQELIERGERLRAEWEEFLPTYEEGDLQEQWITWKEERIPSLEPASNS